MATITIKLSMTVRLTNMISNACQALKQSYRKYSARHFQLDYAPAYHNFCDIMLQIKTHIMVSPAGFEPATY